jgi:hypothetical protein
LKPSASFQSIFRISTLIALSFGNLPRSFAQTSPASGETIVLIRHGEKPDSGLGQLTCKGLNRALALPALLIGRYGKPVPRQNVIGTK